MKKIKWTVLLAILAVCALCVFTSCSADKSGRKELSDVMFSHYAAETEFLFEYEGGSVSGTARITRGESVRINILSPDPYSGISIEGDAADKAEVISISYSGIRADISKEILDKLSLVLAMFSDTAASAIDYAPKDSFCAYEEAYSSENMQKITPYEAHFRAGDVEYIYIYDSITGTPLDMYAKSGGASVQIKIKKLKTEQ